MHASQAPSVDRLHSVGALMDTSFLRDAVADADAPTRRLAAPAVLVRSRVAEWLRKVFARRAGAAR